MTAIVVGIVVVALIGVLAFAGPGEESAASELLGKRAPSTAGPVVGATDATFDIDDHKGSWVVVNFFATWCPPCVVEHDDLVAFDAWAQRRGDVRLVSVVFNDTPEQVDAFFEKRGGEWPVIDDPSIALGYGVVQVPESFVVAPSGQVVAHFSGETTFDELVASIEEYS